MREIQYEVAPTSDPAGSPGRFAATVVNVAPSSLLTSKLPSSVPAHTTPGITGDSEIAVIVPYALTPSFLESCACVPGTPISVTPQRSMCFVRSADSIHLSPRFTDLNSRLPPIQIVPGLCGDSSTGVFQLKRYVSPGCPLMTFDVAAPPRPPPP